MFMSRGQEILTGASPQAAGLTDAHIHTITQPSGGSGVIKTVDICENLHEQIFMNTYFSSASLPTQTETAGPPWDSNYLHTDIISYEQMQVLSVPVGAVCKQFVSK